MMSYLWILLLGSLLASHTAAQDEVEKDEPAVEAEVDDPTGTDGPETVTEPETADDPKTTAEPEPEAAADPVPTAEPQPAADPVPTTDPQVDPVATPEPEEAANPKAETEEAGEESVMTAELPAETVEPELPTEGDAEPTPAVPTEENSGAVPSATDENVDPNPVTTAVPAEAEATTTPQVNDPDAGVNVPEQTKTAAPEGNEPSTVPPAIETETGKEEEDKNPPQEKEGNVGRKIIQSFVNEVKKVFDPNDNTVSEGAITGEKEDQNTKGGSKPLAGILSAIIVSAVGAVTGYFAYQKKKLCFKKGQEADPEAGVKVEKADAAEAKSDPQESNTLLNSSQP